MASISRDCVNVWNVIQGTNAKRVNTITFSSGEISQPEGKLLAAVNIDAAYLVVYKGANFLFNIYTIDTDMGTHKLRETLDLQKEMTRVNKLE
jgi:hypothetical protein